MQRKSFYADIVDKSPSGGRILITTNGIDRDRDRVNPHGVKIENYLKNPVVMWGHSYSSPSDVVGRTTKLEITEEGIFADFELRPAANEQDPQNIVRLLWEGGWIKAASIGFQPLTAAPNEIGGKDFAEWEMLEWSLIPIPANQDALRLAAKAMDMGDEAPFATLPQVEQEAGYIDIAPVGDDASPYATKDAAAPAEEAKQEVSAAPEQEQPAPVDDTAAEQAQAEAQAELRFAAILADFISSIRPYLLQS